MTINLTKGQKIDLTKNNPGLAVLKVGLGWEPNIGRSGEIKSKSLLSSLTRRISEGTEKIRGANFDLDSSIFLVDANEKRVDTVYYGHLDGPNGCIKHHGDNLTGRGTKGTDKENITVDLTKIPSNVNKLVFVVNIYECKSRNQHFGMVEDAFIHINDANTGNELCRFNLTDDYNNKTALMVGEIYRYSGEWKFYAVGEGTNDVSLSEMSNKYR